MAGPSNATAPQRGAAEPPATVRTDPLEELLATRHPLATELARLRVDQLEVVLGAFEAIAAPFRDRLPELEGYARIFARVLDAMRAELRAALAARRLDPTARVFDPIEEAREAQLHCDYAAFEASCGRASRARSGSQADERP